jgi:hypothetical protein
LTERPGTAPDPAHDRSVDPRDDAAGERRLRGSQADRRPGKASEGIAKRQARDLARSRDGQGRSATSRGRTDRLLKIPASRGDLCRVGARPVGPSDSTGVVSGRFSSGASVLRDDVSSRLYDLPLRRATRTKASSGRFSKMRRAILRNEKVTNTAPPRPAGSSHVRRARGVPSGPIPGPPARGPCQGCAGGSPSWPSPAALPWPTRDRLDPLIQSRCLTNPRPPPVTGGMLGGSGTPVRLQCHSCYRFN